MIDRNLLLQHFKDARNKVKQQNGDIATPVLNHVIRLLENHPEYVTMEFLINRVSKAPSLSKDNRSELKKKLMNIPIV